MHSKIKIPGWSAVIIVPLIILVSSIGVLRQSESPVKLGLIIGVSSLVVALVAWGVLAELDKLRS